MSRGRDGLGRRYPWWVGPVTFLGALALRMLGASWRLDRSATAGYDAEIAKGQRCIFAFWHARLLALAFTHRGLGAGVLVSQHRDGELITRVLERMGFVVARGSSTRGGEEGLRELIETAEKGKLLGITPDGPRGPAEQVKPGLVYLAGRTGLPVVPLAVAARPVWKLRSWDGFRIPKPFARVRLVYGPPITVPPGLEREELERWRLELQRAMVAVTDATDAELEAR